jgi:hypothetical protein
MRRQTSRVSFLMCPFCVRSLLTEQKTSAEARGRNHRSNSAQIKLRAIIEIGQVLAHERCHRDEVGDGCFLTVRRAHRHSRARGEGPPGRCQAATARARRCLRRRLSRSLLEHVRVASVSGKSGAFQA